MMNRKLATIALFAAFLVCSQVLAADFDFSGNFTKDNDVVRLNFSVGSDSTITIFSSSWQYPYGDPGYDTSRGFDPILAIWTSAGDLVAQQDDGHVIGSTLSNSVPYYHGNWDSYFDVALTAGDYIATIGEYDNFAVDSLLADGFRYDAVPDFTFTNGYGAQPDFNGVGPEGLDARTSNWQFHILNVNSAQQDNGSVPEPTTLLIWSGLGAMGAVVAMLRRRRNRTAG